jgi:hypothetical protein
MNIKCESILHFLLVIHQLMFTVRQLHFHQSQLINIENALMRINADQVQFIVKQYRRLEHASHHGCNQNPKALIRQVKDIIVFNCQF